MLEAHWCQYFSDRIEEGGVPSLLDLACGEGEVLRFADQVFAQRSEESPKAFCCDIAPAAVGMASGALNALPVAADSAALPFADAAVFCAVSQYGLEYAGQAAFFEAARVIGEGGRLHALVHCRGGVVERACGDVAGLLSAVIDSGLFGRMANYAETIPQAAAGTIPDTRARECVDRLRSALNAVGEALAVASPGPAREHVARLVTDCQTLAARLGHYAPGDVSTWIKGQKSDTEAFLYRMNSMLDVAQSEDDMRAVIGRLEAAGLTVEALSVLEAPGQSGALAWVVDAQRGSVS
ncbi:class I SAM-dependent methyltransferase [Maricaulis virginensis]|uniref:Methyltransferase type 11 domain-containing protein n=1 Tax=Maricaulis virginensis TaxID=144022 RepID=A0A9W6IJZ4_9PROT|nr:methyltransferase domain-containing protein [Maricaulis virginensis]GLK50899.1 hypothetical protein GCM10017621_04070 [Maricaulis virginensis]